MDAVSDWLSAAHAPGSSAQTRLMRVQPRYRIRRSSVL
jgi:hypothetical protein